MNTFFLKIISSDKVFYEGKCQNLILPIEDGEFSVLAHHENMIVAVVNGELHLKTPEGEWITAAVSRGFAEIINNRVSVLVNSAERPEDIDVKRAEEARQRAEERLRQKQEYLMAMSHAEVYGKGLTSCLHVGESFFVCFHRANARD